jgi:tellurite resistance protein TerC/cation:H+ antiporter
MLVETLKQARRIVIAVIGFTVIAIGVAMIVTPGPGWLVIFLGLSILAAEFVWARRLLRRLKRTGVGIGRTLFGRTPRRAAPPRGDSADARAGANRSRTF